MFAINRRTFLQVSLSSASVGLLSQCQPADVSPSLRFAVASDGHYGEPNTPSDTYYTDLLTALTNRHQSSPLDFVVINGDLIHQGNSGLLPATKAYLDKLPVPYYVTRGNHDQVSVATWQALWGYPTNHVVELPKATLVLLDTSDETGAYLCGDAAWLRKAMTTVRADLPVFLFMHIPFIHNVQGTDVCGDIVKVLNDFPTIRAVFHGHDHTKDLGIFYGQAALLFDAHFGSSWGTTYRGYRVVEQRGSDMSTYQYDYVNQKQINSLTF
ncbi:metallophosphoesterase family protein [Spirosoma rhododendri]|uniref:Transcriptional regulator n=1 Tax=Spirosoma rhododendri TaxID=2728024 RepID=A0A7L5DS59_9BACT|nr:metallophosphoesterase [Spirosoma rhododendri]QJD80975.1 transcriptional regulator [Spirosoma rhododendri]